MVRPANEQKAVEEYWDSTPCGSESSNKNRESRSYYLEIERLRYSHQPHILSVLDKIDWRAKKILEVGTGVGTDARSIVARGADYEGINVDHGSVAITAKAFSVFSVQGNVQKCSATALTYDNDTFDVVYSFGVLHHIPDVNQAVSEIYRVLKPGGEVLVMLYNKTSINYYVEIMFIRKVALKLLLMPAILRLLVRIGFPGDKLKRHVELYRSSESPTAQEWLSRNTDGPDNPYSRVYSENEAAALFNQFHLIDNEVHFFDQTHWGVIGNLIPDSVRRWIGRKWGWHRIVHVKKPLADKV